MISSMVMMRSCTGLVLPRTAPKEIRTVAVLKSALIILQERNENRNWITMSKRVYMQKATFIMSQKYSSAFSRTGLWFIEQPKNWQCLFNFMIRRLKKETQKRRSYLKMLTLILPSSMCHSPCMRRPHCRPKAARSRLMPTLLNPYLFRKVIRKPKPMKIMTWTS